MSFESFVGFRFLKWNKENRFLSLVTLISSLGVALGVAVLIVVLSVIDGYENVMKEKILGANAHLILFNSSGSGKISSYQSISKDLLKVEGVERADPFNYIEAMASKGMKRQGIVIKGILPNYLDVIKGFSKLQINGDFFSNKKNIIIGKELASELGVSLGDTLKCLIPKTENNTPMALPKILSFRIAGIFDSGMYEWDRSLTYTSLATVSTITGMKQVVSAVEIRIDDPDSVDKIEEKIRNKLRYPYYTQTWKRMN
ncbi:MAG: ABC transporter permease, partial [Candidatus Schekmanbacteria bacterium]